jgi:hypothetical protein
MKTLRSQLLPAAALAVGFFGAVSAAHAGRTDVHVFIGAPPVPSAIVQPAPAFLQRTPVYAVPPQVEYRYDDRQRWEGRGRWDDRRYGDEHRRHARLYGPYGDLDRDGVMNQDDRDRDGDGVRNRYDRFPDNPYRR